MTYYLAPCLVKLCEELNALFPKRDRSSDGWIGDASHAARKSDHNPDWGADGVVRAIDVDIDDNDAGRDLRAMLLRETIGDPRIWYVISNGKIYSRTYGWAAKAYTGANGHFHHVHVSIQGANGISAEAAQRIEDDVRVWFGPDQPVRTVLPRIDLSVVREQMLAARYGRREQIKVSRSIRRLQRALNAKYDLGLDVDGLAGEQTLNGYGHHEDEVGPVGRRRIPDSRTLPPLIRGRYRMVD